VELFYKFDNGLYEGKYFLVVIKVNTRCFLLTAYITDAIKKGDTLYEQKPENGLR